MSKLFDFLDGKEYVIDGVHGHFKHKSNVFSSHLVHQASEKGKKSAAYKQGKAQMGMDYETEITYRTALLLDISIKLGYKG